MTESPSFLLIASSFVVVMFAGYYLLSIPGLLAAIATWAVITGRYLTRP